MFFGLVATHVSLHFTAIFAQLFLLAVLAHLPLHRPALLVVDELSRLLRPLSLLHLAVLDRLAVAVLLLDRNRILVGKFLAVFTDTRLARLLADNTGRVVAFFRGHLVTVDTVFAIFILRFSTLEINGKRTRTVFHHLLLVPAVIVIDVDALEVVLCRDSQVVDSITDAFRRACAPEYSVGFLHDVVVD